MALTAPSLRPSHTANATMNPAPDGKKQALDRVNPGGRASKSSQAFRAVITPVAVSPGASLIWEVFGKPRR